MKRNLFVGIATLALSVPAFAADDAKAKTAAPAAGADAKAASGMPDMSKMGPMSRPVKNDKQDKKELDAFFKAWGEADKTGDAEALAAMVDFPIMMMTDDSKGAFSMSSMDHDKWVATMKPFMEQMKTMKDVKMTHKGTCTMMSDDLASCEGEMSMQMGKMKGKYNGQDIMVRKDGNWKMKSQMEAGWGDMASASGGSGTTTTGTKPTK